MQKRGISQEGLKGIACVAMLLDHIGATLVPAEGLRIVGRIAFPTYCFLLAEGVFYTKNPGKYGLRLLIGAVLAEIPFDLLLFHEMTWAHCSVMVTLLLGFLYGVTAARMEKTLCRGMMLLPFLAAGEILGSDYGGAGVAMIALFLWTREAPHKRLLQAFGLAGICCCMNSYLLRWGRIGVPIEMFALLALIPIGGYRGRKSSDSRWLQWGFYLFYPLHLAVLLWLQRCIF